MAITVSVVALLILIDQVTKFIATKTMTVLSSHTFIPNVVDFKLTYNDGAAWSLGSEYTWVLALVSLVASIVLMYFCSKLDWKNDKFKAITFSLVLAGCAGNLYDRALTTFGLMDGVVDMISFRWFDAFMGLFGAGKSIFNVADMYLVIGIIMMAIYYLFIEDRKKVKPDANKINK